jgi:hypothetical protein
VAITAAAPRDAILSVPVQWLIRAIAAEAKADGNAIPKRYIGQELPD